MKTRKDELLSIALFCGFLAVMMIGYLLFPGEDFSQREKRYLAEMPEVSWDSVASGEFGADMETYLADHIPGRDFFVGLNAAYDFVSGRQTTKDVRLLSGNRLVEAPVKQNEAQIQRNLASIAAFADTIGRPVDLMIIPSAGWAAQQESRTGLDLFSREPYPDQQIIESIHGQCGSNIRPFETTHILAGHPEYYYKTDHHWTSEGAYRVYCAYMESLGRAFPEKDAFCVETVDGFFGSNHSRAALWSIPADSLELWHSGSELTVTNGESEEVHQGAFYRQRLEENDKYTVYLDGNHSLVRIENPALKGSGKILVIRDSYMNSMGIFLAESYETVVLADLRYYKNPISQLYLEEEFDTILICYSIGNFMTDTNLIWLR